MNIHFIAIGGAVMHNLAIVLSRKGNKVTGSDDKIADPAKSNLEKEGILPAKIGFFAEKITPDLDLIILGMHARLDNPELIKAQELGIKIYSFPEYIYEVSKNKMRIVIAGSHGKTTITSMVMHVLNKCGKEIDYMVGAKVAGFDTAVKITETAPIIILEGDEYLASPIERESKFMFYKPHIALISGIAWDHINIFPVYENYAQQFRKFADTILENGYLAYFQDDLEIQRVLKNYDKKVTLLPYTTPDFEIKKGVSFVKIQNEEKVVAVFGKHNLQNMAGAAAVCKAAGISESDFYDAIADFTGAANRLQKIGESASQLIYKDFAHSPSKMKATVQALSEQYPKRKLLAVMELHTFSSLDKNFLEEYAHGLDNCSEAVLFLDEEAMKLKQMPDLDPAWIKKSFKRADLHIFINCDSLEKFILQYKAVDTNLLLMSSGQFGGLNLERLTTNFLIN